MIKPEYFDIVELLIDLPQYNLSIGEQGAIVECFEDDSYEVEFTNSDGETLALCNLSNYQFIVIWKSATKTWLSLADKINLIINILPDSTQNEVLDFAHFLYKKYQFSNNNDLKNKVLN